MMDSDLFLFGMKLARQHGNVEFFDADFSTTLLVASPTFSENTLLGCCEMINQRLLQNGFDSETLAVGKLKGIDDFDLGNIVVRG